MTAGHVETCRTNRAFALVCAAFLAPAAVALVVVGWWPLGVVVAGAVLYSLYRALVWSAVLRDGT